MWTFRKGYHAIKKEKWDMKIIRTWLGEWRVLKEIEDLSTCTRDDLDNVLKFFFAEVRKAYVHQA